MLESLLHRRDIAATIPARRSQQPKPRARFSKRRLFGIQVARVF